jgi:hypothetical protein
VTARLAGRLLRRAYWSLRLDTWSATLARWSRPVGAALPLGAATTGALIDTVDDAIRTAASRQLFFPVACKERALVGHHLLRVVFGLPAALVLGVQHYPFCLHAWVEIDGRIVTDDEGYCDGFEPVARFE